MTAALTMHNEHCNCPGAAETVTDDLVAPVLLPCDDDVGVTGLSDSKRFINSEAVRMPVGSQIRLERLIMNLGGGSSV